MILCNTLFNNLGGGGAQPYWKKLKFFPFSFPSSKANLSNFSNNAMLQAVEAQNDSCVVTRELLLEGSKESLYGFFGEKNSIGQMPDGIHIRGRQGGKSFTNAVMNMLYSL